MTASLLTLGCSWPSWIHEEGLDTACLCCRRWWCDVLEASSADDSGPANSLHSATQSTPDIIRRSGIIRADMQSLDNHFRKSRISITTKLKLYNTCILSIFLYRSECWAITKVDACSIDALNQWCMRTLLGIKWYQFVHNEEVRRITKQPNLTAIIQSRRLSIFGHIARIDDDADAKMILTAPPPENC